MSQLGLGVIINMLGGNEETINTIKSSLNKVIKSIKLDNDELVMEFEDDTKIKIFDDGQSCCEHRYMNCDDNLEQFVGAQFLNAEIREGKTIQVYSDEHDIQFLVVITNKGNITFSNHNEHNGYYGGFWIVAQSAV